MSFKRSFEDEVLRNFQAPDVDKKGYLDELELDNFKTNYGKNIDSDKVRYCKQFFSHDTCTC